MRSRTSRGVPEWSGGKDLYMGSPVSGIGTSFGVIGIVPGPPEGSRGSTGWGHLPRGATWAVGGAPWPTWAKGTSPKRPMRLGFTKGKSPTSGRHLLGALGGRETSLGRRPPRRSPPLALLYIVGEGGPLTPRLWCLPLPLQHILLLHSAWRSPAGVLQLHHHHAVVLLLEPSPSTSPLPLLDQEGGDVAVPYVC